MTDAEMRQKATDITDLKVMVARMEERLNHAIEDISDARDDTRNLWERVYPLSAWGGVAVLFIEQYVRGGK